VSGSLSSWLHDTALQENISRDVGGIPPSSHAAINACVSQGFVDLIARNADIHGII
jgi:hypothetical protein